MQSDAFGRYVVRRRLGSGAFATVWLCADPDLDALVAVKVLSDNYAHDEDIKARFIQEARILRQLDDERILRVHTIDSLPDGRPYFVADYADGGTLEAFVGHRMASTSQPSSGPFTLEETLVLSRDLAMCLTIAHSRKIVHRDLKPSNVLFRTPSIHRDGGLSETQQVPTMDDLIRGRARMVLADFGIARALESATGYTISAGTPYYMAPEQADASADERTDLYAAAVIMYELLAGAKPYPYPTVMEVVRRQLTEGPPSISSLRGDLPPSVDDALRKGMAVEPDQRFQSAAEWMRALDDIASETVGSTPDSTIVGDSHATIIADQSAPIGAPPASSPVPPPPPAPEDPAGSASGGPGPALVPAGGSTSAGPTPDPAPAVPNGVDAQSGLAGVGASLPPGTIEPPAKRNLTPFLVGGGVLVALIAAALFFLLRGGPPPLPTEVMAAATVDGVVVAWVAPTGEDLDIAEYRVYRDGELVAGVPGTRSDYLDAGASITESHRYQIQSRDSDDRTSDLTEAITAQPIAAPAAPGGLEATVGATSIEISWAASVDRSENLVSEYGVYRDGSLVGIVDADTTRYLDDDADVSVAHDYAVDAAATEDIRSPRSAVVTTEAFLVPLLENEAVDGTFRPGGGVDSYSFAAEAGDFVTVFLSTDDDREGVVEVSTADGRIIGSSSGTSVELDLQIDEAGTYVARVSTGDANAAGYSIFYRTVSELTIGGSGRSETLVGLDEWTFVGNAGQLVAATLWPDRDIVGEFRLVGLGLDTELAATNGGEPIFIVEQLPEDGRYYLQVEYLEGAGGYDLNVLPLVEFNPRSVFRGTLGGTLNEDFADFFEFEAVVGSQLFVQAVPEDTGAAMYLALFDLSGEIVELPDNAFTYVVPEDGVYEVGVSFLTGSGEFTLFVEKHLFGGLAGVTVDQTLDSANSLNTYSFLAEQGELVLVQMTSADPNGDPLLVMRGPGPDRSLVIDENDDAYLDGSRTAVVWEFIPETGVYFIDAQMFGDAFGSYELIITRFVR